MRDDVSDEVEVMRTPPRQVYRRTDAATQPTAPPVVSIDADAGQQISAAAYCLQHRAPSVYLQRALQGAFKGELPVEACDLYLKQLLPDTGHGVDPLEQMLVEQLALTHHSIGQLVMKGTAAATHELSVAYHTAAGNLMAQYRQSMLALRKYREPRIPNNVTVVKQQNLAQSQQVAYVEQAAPAPVRKKTRRARMTGPGTQLASKGGGHNGTQQDCSPQSETSGGWEEECDAAEGPEHHRPGATAASRLAGPAVAPFDRPAVRRR